MRLALNNGRSTYGDAGRGREVELSWRLVTEEAESNLVVFGFIERGQAIGRRGPAPDGGRRWTVQEYKGYRGGYPRFLTLGTFGTLAEARDWLLYHAEVRITFTTEY